MAANENPILGAWQKTLARRGPDAALIGTAGEILQTFRQIESESRRFETMLLRLRAHSVCAIRIGNSYQWPALFLACLRRKIIALPLDEQSGNNEEIFRTCRVRALITRQENELSLIEVGENGFEWNEPVPHFLKLTSGTTAAPRVIRFRSGQLLADCENICDMMGIGEDDLNFGVIPFSHSYGFSNLITPLLCRSVPLVVSEDRLPRAISSGIASSGATVFPGMPVLYQSINELSDLPQLPRLRLCISAGAPLPPDVAQKFSRRAGVKVHTFYGASECGGIAYDASDTAEYEAGFLGEAMRNVHIETDECERIEVRSAAVGDGYFPTPEPDGLGNGRFVPADLVKKTSRGFFLIGRASDVINIAGRKLNPIEVEAQLRQFPGVKAAVVFGVGSKLRNEEVIACVIANPPLPEKDLLQFCRERLPAWQVPKSIWLVNEIPVNERGKISRRQLAQQYLARQQERSKTSLRLWH